MEEQHQQAKADAENEEMSWNPKYVYCLRLRDENIMNNYVINNFDSLVANKENFWNMVVASESICETCFGLGH